MTDAAGGEFTSRMMIDEAEGPLGAFGCNAEAYVNGLGWTWKSLQLGRCSSFFSWGGARHYWSTRR